MKKKAVKDNHTATCEENTSKEIIYSICLEHIYRPGFARFTFINYDEYQQALEVLQKEIGHDFIWTRPLPTSTMSINLKYFSEVQGYIEEE